jgi:hypothetical protein
VLFRSAVVCRNLLKVVTYEVLAPAVSGTEAVWKARTAIAKQLQGQAASPQERMHLSRKQAMLDRLAQLCGLGR